MSTRRKARELALCALYAYEFSKNPLKQVEEEIISDKADDAEILKFAGSLFKSTIKHGNELDELIKIKALNWDFNRIAVMDKLILRMAICEFLRFGDIPPKVSIDEAIEISKKYSTEKSGKFINGILDSVLSDLRKSDRLNKKGRGLIDGNTRKSEPF
ncbi:transcription antitermination factor NusB [candidate division KSB1 bacterium]|nr:transcription antitermination factor NusB [candidate division KSB1 bacterium]MBL7092930.1 transcription antitermination factor NusB [candidate division KSB1 bacterium]